MSKNENNEALSSEINEKAVVVIHKRVEQSAAIIESIVSKLVAEHCKPLDDYVDFIHNILLDTENPPTDSELDEFALNLAVSLYYAGEAQETLGIKEDIAKAIKAELYNESFDAASGTISDKTAKAELATQAEFISQMAYSRAYKKVKLRVEAANELLQSVKKVISRRISEYELTRVDPGRIGAK